jgi:hypothetical protein
MKTIMLTGVCLMLTASAMAQTNCQTIGNQTYCHGPNGYNSNSQTLGNNTYIQERAPGVQQRNTTCQRIGNQLYCN